jgi:hypothetical protein
MSETTIYTCDGCGKTLAFKDLSFILSRTVEGGAIWAKAGPRDRLAQTSTMLSALKHACSRECAVKIADAMRKQLEKL